MLRGTYGSGSAEANTASPSFLVQTAAQLGQSVRENPEEVHFVLGTVKLSHTDDQLGVGRPRAHRFEGGGGRSCASGMFAFLDLGRSSPVLGLTPLPVLFSRAYSDVRRDCAFM